MKTKEEVIVQLKEMISIPDLAKIILSNPIKKDDDIPKKVDIRKVISKEDKYFQFSYYIANKVIHKNVAEDTIIVDIIDIMENNFKQCEIFANQTLTLLMNKKKQFKVTSIKESHNIKIQNHNKIKNYLLKDGEYLDWLYQLDVMNKNGIVFNSMQKKFKQINKFLETLDSINDNIPPNAKIVDMGCGKSYLSFAMYHYFNNIKNKNVTINGYDLKKDVVEHCNELSHNFGFKNIEFFNEDIQNINEENIHMVVSLHACNTATDYALFFGIKSNCDVIISVPCCHNEIFTQIKNDDLASMLSYGILKERFSSLLTDSIRADILEIYGYKVNLLEFIDATHTPKNLMIKATKSKNFNKNQSKLKELNILMNNFSVTPTLFKLIEKL